MDLMNALHGVVAEYYKDYMQAALDDGEEVSSGTLAAVNTFLKNNNVTVDIVESDNMLDLGLQLRDMVDNEPHMKLRKVN